jgi:hypothetical protein
METSSKEMNRNHTKTRPRRPMVARPRRPMETSSKKMNRNHTKKTNGNQTQGDKLKPDQGD